MTKLRYDESLILPLFCNVFLKTTCRFIGDSHLDAEANERINISLSELALILKTAVGHYFCQ